MPSPNRKTLKKLFSIFLALVISLTIALPADAITRIGVDPENYQWTASDEFAKKHLSTSPVTNTVARDKLLQRHGVASGTAKMHWSQNLNNQKNTVVSQTSLQKAIENHRYTATADTTKFRVAVAGKRAQAQKTNNNTDWSVRCEDVTTITVKGVIQGQQYNLIHLDDTEVSSSAPNCT